MRAFQAQSKHPSNTIRLRHKPDRALHFAQNRRKDLHLNCCLSPAASSLQPFSIDPCGIRTQPNQLERLVTSPEVERAMLCAHWVRKVGREVLEPRLRIFSPPLIRLSYRPIIGENIAATKKARCRGDTGLWEMVSEYGQGVTGADSGWGATFHH